ncbi:MAG: AtpZ/AtpI family protein [Holosporales bacterium]|jgi:F0F1-type ATP synthase assembly protein I|nr:AtpZ/AtpI family protein [Holosporales bacterium]
MTKRSELSLEERLRRCEERIRPPQKSRFSGFSRKEQPLIRAGIEFFSGVSVSMLLGVAVDRVTQTHPWGLLVGFFLGIGAGFWNVIRLIKM